MDFMIIHKIPKQPIQAILPIQNPPNQLFLALHIIIAIRTILSSMENGPTQEINALVIIDKKLHREIEYLVLIEPIHHKSAL